MNGSRIHVDTIIDTTWIPRENCMALKIYPCGIHVVFRWILFTILQFICIIYSITQIALYSLYTSKKRCSSMQRKLTLLANIMG